MYADVCMYTCIYVYMYICIHVYMYIRIICSVHPFITLSVCLSICVKNSCDTPAPAAHYELHRREQRRSGDHEPKVPNSRSLKKPERQDQARDRGRALWARPATPRTRWPSRAAEEIAAATGPEQLPADDGGACVDMEAAESKLVDGQRIDRRIGEPGWERWLASART